MPHPENSPTGKPDVSPPSQRRYFLAQYEVENEPSQALEELCSHSPLFSLVLQNTPLVLIYIDRDRTIRFAEGKGIEGLRKLTVEEWIGQPFEEIFDEGEGIQKAVERGLKDETINTVIQTGPFSLEFHVLPVKDESGQVVGVFGIATNITERFLYHQALQESEQRFEAIFEHLTIGVMLQTLEGELLDCNTAIQQMLGGTCKDLRQQNLVEYVHPADRPALVSAYTDLVQSKHAEFQKEIRVKDKGAVAWARITASVVKSSLGEPLFIVSLIEDISKEKQIALEKREVQRRLLQGREQERLALAQELHDGPLQDIIGISYALEALHQEGLSTAKPNSLQSIQRSLDQLIHQVRSICGDLRPPALAPFGLERAVRSHIQIFQSKHPEIQVYLNLAKDEQRLPNPVRIALYRIYQESLNNVIRHANASNLWIWLNLEDNQVSLEIQDDGSGFTLPPSWLEMVRSGHLGLAGAIERTESINGTFSIESSPNLGTTIRVVVPLNNLD